MNTINLIEREGEREVDSLVEPIAGKQKDTALQFHLVPRELCRSLATYSTEPNEKQWRNSRVTIRLLTSHQATLEHEKYHIRVGYFMLNERSCIEP
jgi:hypothetical protein